MKLREVDFTSADPAAVGKRRRTLFLYHELLRVLPASRVEAPFTKLLVDTFPVGVRDEGCSSAPDGRVMQVWLAVEPRLLARPGKTIAAGLLDACRRGAKIVGKRLDWSPKAFLEVIDELAD